MSLYESGYSCVFVVSVWYFILVLCCLSTPWYVLELWLVSAKLVQPCEDAWPTDHRLSPVGVARGISTVGPASEDAWPTDHPLSRVGVARGIS